MSILSPILRHLLVAATISVTVACSSHRAADAPKELSDFASENFPGQTIASWHTEDDPRGKHYVMTMADSTAVKFNEHFKWIRVETADGKSVPLSMIHEGIQNYFAENNIDPDSVVRIEKIPRVGYDVTLSDRTKLLFNTKGEILSR